MKVLRVLSRFQKSHNELSPVDKHASKSGWTILNLPEEIVIHLLKKLHVKDLLSMRQVHSYFRNQIDYTPSIWCSVSFHDSWPSPSNLHHFDKAASAGNIEALVKLAVAYLYNEGLPAEGDGKKVSRNGIKAAEMFCKVEALTSNTDPFTWLFIRPPWSLNGACCKECVFNYMKDYVERNKCSQIEVCVAKTLQLLDMDKYHNEIVSYLEHAASQGSSIAACMLWTQMKAQLSVLDKAGELECIRKLRDICSMNHLDTKLVLCHYYAIGKYGGISKAQAMSFIRDFVHSVPALNTQECFYRSQELTASMRYILVDWLAEVAAMKLFSTHTFHVAVGVIDRFLCVNSVPRSKLQLLGVSAMVLCSRLLGSDIITIREAAWLTDNTYKYEDVVRMMGEITASLHGNLRKATSVDFAEIFNTFLGHDRHLCYLSQYICELALLQAEMGQYSPAETAASAIMLSRLLTKLEDPWPSSVQEATGFCIEDLNRCAFHMHEKCFLEGSVVDHRDVTLQAVKQRYADIDCCKVSEIEIISYSELCKLLGVTHHFVNGMDIHVHFTNDDELIVSPSKKKRRSRLHNGSFKTTSTPKTLLRKSVDGLSARKTLQCLNDSVSSGYYGDKEDDLDDSIITDESIEDLKREILCEESMAAEMDTLQASLSIDNTRSPQKSTFDLSAPSPFKHCLSFSCSMFNCDTTLGVLPNKNSEYMDETPSTSGTSQSSSLTASSSGSFINLRTTSMILRSTTVTSGVCGSMSSDSETNLEITGGSSVKRLCSSKSLRHMTLRNTPKRRSRRASGGTCEKYRHVDGQELQTSGRSRSADK